MTDSSTILKATVAAALFAVGAVLYPRPAASVDPAQVVSKALAASPRTSSPAIEVRHALAEHCTPIFEGYDNTPRGRFLAVRFKPPHRRYPWIEVWVDSETAKFASWREWGVRHGRITVLASSDR